jgi:hypothetical protein
MQMSPSERLLIAQTIQFLEATRHLAVIPVGQVPDALLVDLMSSANPDVHNAGCYLAARVDPNVDLSYLGIVPGSARNYARFLLSRYSVNQVFRQSPPTALSAHVRDLAKQIPGRSRTSTSRKVDTMTLIVHGSWARTEPWWQRGVGNFWDDINSQVQDVYARNDPFSWSGDVTRLRIGAAAEELVEWVNRHPARFLRIIAHSNGGNVCMQASRLGLKIQRLILLGTPICHEFIPDLTQIEVLHNVFSTADEVQTPIAMQFLDSRGGGRTLGDSTTLLNHRATIPGLGNDPEHSDLHEGSIWRRCGLDRLLA